MLKGLIISNNELLNDIYSMNLQAYVNVETIHQGTLKEGLTYLKSYYKELDIVITSSHINKVSCALPITKLMEAESIKLPLLIIGERRKISSNSNVYIIPTNLNIKKLVKTAAHALGVTAKDMVNKSTSKFYPIPIKVFKNIDDISCSIYIKTTDDTGNRYSKIFDPGKLNNGQIEKYIKKGFLNFYIPASQRLSVINHASERICQELKYIDIRNTKSSAIVLEKGHNPVALHLSQNNKINKQIVEISKKCTKTMTDVSASTPELKELIDSMLSIPTNYLYMHTILTSYVSKHLLENISWGSKEYIEKIQFVIFFHDIHLAPIYARYPRLKYEDDLLFQSTLDDSEKEVLISHARLAAETIRTIPNAPPGADSLLRKHHGMNSGEGFPLELSEEGLVLKFKDHVPPLAKIMIIAEEFVNQMLKQKNETGAGDMTDAIKHLSTKFTGLSYKKMMTCFAGLHL